jgi:hypothetical protein
MADPRDRRKKIADIDVSKVKERLAKIEDREKNTKTEWHWSFTVAIAGGILGGITSLIIYSFTIMSYAQFAMIVLGPGLLAFLIQWKYFFGTKFIQKHFRMNMLVYALYNFAGIGFTVASLFLLLNWLGASTEEKVERHKILGIDRDYIVDSNYLTVILLEDDAYADNPNMRSVPYADAMRRKSFPYFDIKYTDGLLGFPIFQGQGVSSGKEKGDNEK